MKRYFLENVLFLYLKNNFFVTKYIFYFLIIKYNFLFFVVENKIIVGQPSNLKSPKTWELKPQTSAIDKI